MVSLECVQCDFKCKTKSGLTVHKYVHGNAKYNCNICGSQFSTNSNLQTHIKSVHEKRTFSCSVCNFKATEERSLRRHQLSVHEQKKFPCVTCSYEATLKNK